MQSIKAKTLIVSIIATLSIASCEQKIENPKIPDQKEGYAIEASLTAGDNAKAYISESTSIQKGLELPDPKMTEVKLLQGNKRLANLKDSGNGFFTADKQIRAQQAYQVEVSGPEGTATGSATIPTQVGIDTIIFEDSADRFPNNDFYHGVKMAFEDPGETKDYYLLEGVIADTAADQPQRSVDISAISPVISFQYDDTKVFFKDQSFNGNRFSLTVYINAEDYPPDILRKRFVLKFKHITKSYFDYFQALEQKENSSGTNPFSTEPALTQGNVEGGFGCVAGINTDTATIRN